MPAKRTAAKKRAKPKPAGVTYLVTGPETCYGVEPGGTFFVAETDRVNESPTIAGLLHRHLIIPEPTEVVSDDN